MTTAHETIDPIGAWNRLAHELDPDILRILGLRRFGDVSAAARANGGPDGTPLRIYLAHLVGVVNDASVRLPGKALAARLQPGSGIPPRKCDLQKADWILRGDVGDARGGTDEIRVAHYSGRCCGMDWGHVWARPPVPIPQTTPGVCGVCQAALTLELIGTTK